MNRTIIFVWCVFTAACIAAPLVIHIRAHQRWVDRERALQQQAERLAQLSPTDTTSQDKPQTSASPPTLSEAEHVELLQLRSEVGRLRHETNSVAQLQDDNRRLAAQPAARTNPAAAQDFPRESWAFSGYGTPEAALQSFLWGMNQANRKVMLDSLAGEMSDQFAKQLAGIADDKLAAEMSNGISKISGYRITAREMLPDDEMLLQIEPTDSGTNNNRKPIVKLKKFGAEWKLVSTPGR